MSMVRVPERRVVLVVPPRHYAICTKSAPSPPVILPTPCAPCDFSLSSPLLPPLSLSLSLNLGLKVVPPLENVFLRNEDDDDDKRRGETREERPICHAACAAQCTRAALRALRERSCRLHGYVSGRAVFSEGADREQLDGPRMSMGSDTMARRGARPLLPSSLSYLLPEAMCSLWSRRDTSRETKGRETRCTERPGESQPRRRGAARLLSQTR